MIQIDKIIEIVNKKINALTEREKKRYLLHGIDLDFRLDIKVHDPNKIGMAIVQGIEYKNLLRISIFYMGSNVPSNFTNIELKNYIFSEYSISTNSFSYLELLRRTRIV